MKRSRFIAALSRTDTEEQAREAIDRERRAYPDARHHCSAYIVRPQDQGPRLHSSDDGEPAGTAGNPMLEVLQHADLENVTAVVTRYFGGTLLGTGGLVRAYSGAVQEALTGAPLVSVEDLTRFLVSVPLDRAGRAESMLRATGWNVLGTSWGRLLVIEIAASADREAELASAVSSLTRTQPDVRSSGTIRTELDTPGRKA